MSNSDLCISDAVLSLFTVLTASVFGCCTFVFCPMLLLDSPVTDFTFIFYPICGVVLGLSCLIPISKNRFILYWGSTAFLFGLCFHFSAYERELAWGRGTTPKYYPYGDVWKEPFSVAQVEASVVRDLVFLVLGVKVTLQIMSDLDQAGRSLNEMKTDVRYGEPMRFMHMTNAALFGYMIADFLSPGMNTKFAAHHIAACLCCLLGSFWGSLPALSWLMLSTCVMEMGGMMYNAFLVYGWRSLFIYLYPFTNLFYFAVLLTIVIRHKTDDDFARYRYLISALGLALVVGRQMEWYSIYAENTL